MPLGNQARVLENLFGAAVSAVEPARLVRQVLAAGEGGARLVRGAHTIARLDDRIVRIVAAGKAAPAMARGALDALGSRVAGGVVVAPFAEPLADRLETFVGGHPLPNGGSVAAGRAAWRLAGRMRPGELLLVLLSGGASSLLALPAPGVTLANKVRTTELLLRAGASIAEVNAVRKHLSVLKGGGLARRAGDARVVALVLSDVIGSSPAVIGSGPAAVDPTTFAVAWRVLERYRLVDRVPIPVRRRLRLGCRGRVRETVKSGERAGRHFVIGDVGLALHAAAARARRLGWAPRIVTKALRGDTSRAAERFAAAAIDGARSWGGRLCLLAGGETTVEVRGKGVGGRNQEFALVFARAIEGRPGISLLSAGSDGVDGPTDAAGAFVDGSTIDRARSLDLDAEEFLARNDSHRFFEALGDLFRPGATGTNVMDLKIALVRPRGR